MCRAGEETSMAQIKLPSEQPVASYPTLAPRLWKRGSPPTKIERHRPAAMASGQALFLRTINQMVTAKFPADRNRKVREITANSPAYQERPHEGAPASLNRRAIGA